MPILAREGKLSPLAPRQLPEELEVLLEACAPDCTWFPARQRPRLHTHSAPDCTWITSLTHSQPERTQMIIARRDCGK